MNVGNLTRIVASIATSGVLTAAGQQNDLSENAVRKERPTIEREIGKAITEAVRTEGIAVVGVKSAAASKINWTAVAGPIASVITALTAGYGFELTAEQIVAAVIVIQTVQSGITAILRTFYTKSVTPASMGASG